MIRNHLKIAWRNILKHRGNASINMLGLALGMTVSLLIGLWIHSEIQYDRFYSKTDRIAQVYTRDTFEGASHTWGATPTILAPFLKQEHPEIEEIVRVLFTDNHLIQHDEQGFKADGLASDSGFFKLFDFNFLAGNPATALSSPDAIVLTASTAIKLFGKTDIVDQTLTLDDFPPLRITGVIQDIPSNSKFKDYAFYYTLDFLNRVFLHNTGWSPMETTSWTAYNAETYVLLKEGVSLPVINPKISKLVQQHSEETKAEIYLYPANRWHLYNKSENGEMVAGNIVTLRMFALIGLFILLIACINFINLSTAGAERRAKEVGVRKAIGAPRKRLIQQFLIESCLITLFAGGISLLLTFLVLPYFNQLTQSDIHIQDHAFLFWPLFIAIIGIATLGAGIYPAFVLSAFEPIKTLKGQHISGVKWNFRPRQVLVTLQFTISIGLGSCTLIISQQIRHAQHRESGYQQDQLVYTKLDGDLGKNALLIRDELLQQGIASHISRTLGIISQSSSNSWGFSWIDSHPEDYDLVFDVMSSDSEFTPTMGIQLLAGRDLDIHTYATDSNAVLLNETAVKRMRLENPIGTQIIQSKGTPYEKAWHVVGVINDFIWASPYQEIPPMMIQGPAAAGTHAHFRYMHIRLNPSKDLVATMDKLQATLKKYNPNYPIDIRFADESYALKFAQQKRTASLTSLFSGLAIFIACLGLFGLVSFATVQRQKEIGIRKVLGASVSSIASLLSGDFVKLVLLAILIASPIAYWLMELWLADFAYRITIQWWTFALSGIMAVLIALLTVSSMAIRAARANPVDSLRDE